MDLKSIIDLTSIGSFAILMFGMIITLMMKDIAIEAVIGIRIYMSRSFNPGDRVYIDGKMAVIIQQDFHKTIFQIQDERGTIWMYVFNAKFKDLLIEKIITDTVMM